LPGYNTLLYQVLVELKKKDIHKITKNLFNTLNELLYNEKLLSIYLRIIFNKTKLFASHDVFKAFDFID
jgi:hypothetical protein